MKKYINEKMFQIVHTMSIVCRLYGLFMDFWTFYGLFMDFFLVIKTNDFPYHVEFLKTFNVRFVPTCSK